MGEGRGKNGENTPKPLPHCIIRHGCLKGVMNKVGKEHECLYPIGEKRRHSQFKESALDKSCILTSTKPMNHS